MCRNLRYPFASPYNAARSCEMLHEENNASPGSSYGTRSVPTTLRDGTDTTTTIAVAVVERGGHYLVGKRPEGVPLAGYWEFPGGKIEPGETAEQAAVRECREETGLDVTAAGRFPRASHLYEHGTVEIEFIACVMKEYPSAAPQSPFVWMPVEKLSALRFPPANEKLLRALTTT